MIKLGKISFVNVLPIYHFLKENSMIEIISMVPSQLNVGIKERSLDISPVSSFAYAEDHQDYFVLPNLSISCKGKVRSIFLFSKYRNLEDLEDKTIALTSQSATSINLLKVILKKFFNVYPNYIHLQETDLREVSLYDAILLIGDEAIKAKDKKCSNYFHFDLGKLWYETTGRSMTYALWVCRKSTYVHHKEMVLTVLQNLSLSKAKGLSNIDLIINEAKKIVGGSVTFWENYFSNLIFDFDENEKLGLELFFDYAEEINLLKNSVKVNFLDAK